MKIFKLTILHKYIILSIKKKIEAGNMNGITIILWIIIAIIAIISIIMVKLHYKENKLGNNEESILKNSESLNRAIDAGKNILSRNKDNSQSTHNQLNPNYSDNIENNVSFNDIYEEPAVYEFENSNTYNNVEFESQNQVLVDYGNTVEKFQEPIKQSQMDIMNQNNNPTNEKHELKDLFTIDELIKESKRKDSERERETHSDDDEEINELKESIKQRQENNIEDSLIEEITDEKEDSIAETINETENEVSDAVEEEKTETINDIINETDSTDAVEEKKTETINDIINETDSTDAVEEEKTETINDIINETDSTDAVEEGTINDLIGVKESEDEKIETEDKKDIETPVITSQDIEEAINTASQEVEEEPKSISESSGITDVLLDSSQEATPSEEIKEPILKTPTKVDESKLDYKFGADLNEEDVFGEYENELDYRKDLAKITNTIKGSKIFQDVKERFVTSEPNHEYDTPEEDFIRNVNEYDDEFAPIVNETHADFEATYEEFHDSDFDDRIRRENTKRVFDIVKDSPKSAESKIESIKEKPSRDNIKIQINNNEFVLKKGDEIIFNHLGETYSSQVYAINGDDISVKYRRQNITIKPSDVKKVY